MQLSYNGSLNNLNLMRCIYLFFFAISTTHSFTPFLRTTGSRRALTRQNAVEVAAASLLAGSLAGAIGVGVAHPLDTLNIKCQVLQAATSLEKLNAKRKQTIDVVDDMREDGGDSYFNSQLDGVKTMNSSAAIDPARRNFSTRLQATASSLTQSTPRRQMNFSRSRLSPFAPSDRIISTSQHSGDLSSDHLGGIEGRARVDTWQVMRHVYATEGLAGFLGGIRIMMVGQGLVKACSFTVNSVVLNWEVAHASSQTDSPTTATFLIAAASAGFVSSFIVNPVERVKILLQAASSSDRKSESELECIQRVLKSEGLGGFLGRGLGTTMLREVPSDAIYFSVYGLLMQAIGGGIGGSGETMVMAPWLASLLFGAASGVASWIPVYPVDYVKTLVQDTNSKDSAEDGSPSAAAARDTWQVVRDLYASGGVGAFYDGISPKLLRAGVFHAVTFWVYDTILPSFESTLSLIHLSP